MLGPDATRISTGLMATQLRLSRVVVTAVWVCLGLTSTTWAQSAENVAVVINENSAASITIGERYAEARALPSSNVLRIRTPAQETIDRPTYETTIERPISAAIAREGLQDRILYLVLTKDVPIRVAGTVGLQGTVASVDSELTLLYRALTGKRMPTSGRVENPYYLGSREVSTALRFSHQQQDIYLVSRLDAFTVPEALGLVDAALKPAGEGRVVLDQRAPLVNSGADEWLAAAAQKLVAQGGADRVLLETTPKPVRDAGPVLGYYSWGATDPQLRARKSGMQFVPGAIASTLAGTDARTFQEPPVSWVPMHSPGDRSTHFRGSPQSLTGDLIREGITGVAGHVADPLLDGLIRPEILFPAYLSGFNLVESFYLAMPFLSWQSVVVGDPLFALPNRKPLTRADVEEGIDPQTELPGHFSRRRIEVATSTGVIGSDPAALRGATPLLLRAEVRLSRKDFEGARSALEKALAIAPGLVAPHLTLAALDETAGSYDAAIAHYRRIIELQPTNVVALNNLAFGLATRKNAPAEAKPLAERAVGLARQNPNNLATLGWVLDTHGWIEHLLGNDRAAEPLVAEATRRAPAQPELRLHAAHVYAALGERISAEAHFKEALRLAPELESREDVGALGKRIESLPPP